MSSIAEMMPERSRRAIVCLLPWLPTVALSFYMKWAIVRWDAAMMLPQLLSLPPDTPLPAQHWIALFLADVQHAALLLLLLFLASLPRLTGRVGLHLVLSAVSSLGLFLQLQSFYQLGRFCSYAYFLAALHYPLENVAVAKEYFSSGGAIKLLAVLSAIVISAMFASRVLQRGVEPSRRTTLRKSTVLIPTLLLLLTTAPLIAAEFSLKTHFHDGVLAKAFMTALAIDPEARHETGLYSATTEELQERYAALSGISGSVREAQLGRAATMDVLIVVLETAPAALLQPLDAFPSIAQLAETALIAEQHFSTYAITNRALFSIATSWYPSNSHTNSTQQFKELSTPGLVRALYEQGYATAFFTPTSTNWENDERMLHGLGFEKIVSPVANERGSKSEEILPLQVGIVEETQTLEALRQHIRDWKAKNRSYLAVYAPQRGHGPWKAAGARSLLEAGHAVLLEQDTWIAALVETLKEVGSFERTLLVITADHGVRTAKEWPGQYRPGFADELSFKVPLIISNPRLFKQPYRITAVSSHIDIAPSLLELLGVAKSSPFRTHEQGLSLWDERLEGRRTYFFGAHFLGVDAMHVRGEFAMYSPLRVRYCTSMAGLRFSDSDCEARLAGELPQQFQAVSQLSRLQHAWVRRFGTLAATTRVEQQRLKAETHAAIR